MKVPTCWISLLTVSVSVFLFFSFCAFFSRSFRLSFVSFHVDSSGGCFFLSFSKCSCVFLRIGLLFKLVEKLSTINFMLRNAVDCVWELCVVWIVCVLARITWERENLPEKVFADWNAPPIDHFRQAKKTTTTHAVIEATKPFGNRFVDDVDKDRTTERICPCPENGYRMWATDAIRFSISCRQMHSFALWSV